MYTHTCTHTHSHRPSGWDNEKKISILYEHMKSINPEDPFDSIIMTPKTSQVSTADKTDLQLIGYVCVVCLFVFCLLFPDLPQLFILQAIKAGDKAGEEASGMLSIFV